MIIDFRNPDLELTPDFGGWCDTLSRKVFNHDSEKSDCCLNIQQKQLLKSLRENRFNIIKSPRQMGVTTVMLINTAYNILYGHKYGEIVSEDKNSVKKGDIEYSELYIYSTFQSAKSVIERFEKIIDMCEERVLLLDKDTFSIKFKFRDRTSVVKFIPEELIKKGVSKCDSIIVDNSAWVNDETMNRIPALSRNFNCNVTVASTPKQESGFFYELWRETLYGRGCFKPTALKWYLDERFNKNLKGTEGLANYDADNIGMMFETLECGNYLSNEWYKERKEMFGPSWVTELDGNFSDRYN